MSKDIDIPLVINYRQKSGAYILHYDHLPLPPTPLRFIFSRRIKLQRTGVQCIVGTKQETKWSMPNAVLYLFCGIKAEFPLFNLSPLFPVLFLPLFSLLTPFYSMFSLFLFFLYFLYFINSLFFSYLIDFFSLNPISFEKSFLTTFFSIPLVTS